MAGNGLYFPKFPQMDIRHIKRMQEDQQIGDSIQEIESEESLNDVKKYYDDCQIELRGKAWAVYGNIYQIQ